MKELLDYEPTTGIFTWRVERGGKKAGDIAGCRKRAYVAISVDDKIYRAHLLAWLWMTGRWPAQFLDHKDLNKQNNAFSNLREASKSQNMANVGIIRSNKGGFKGVSRHRAGEARGLPWQASIQKDSRTIHLGHFARAEEAHAAYCAAAKKLFGEFARAS
ncbi:MAG: HNH endonuclease signature motif containing protein [Hyphomicrobium sp.]